MNSSHDLGGELLRWPGWLRAVLIAVLASAVAALLTLGTEAALGQFDSDRMSIYLQTLLRVIPAVALTLLIASRWLVPASIIIAVIWAAYWWWTKLAAKGLGADWTTISKVAFIAYYPTTYFLAVILALPLTRSTKKQRL